MAKKKKKGGGKGRGGGGGGACAASPADAVHAEAALLERHRRERKALSKANAKLEQEIILAGDAEAKAALQARIDDGTREVQERHERELLELREKSEPQADGVADVAAAVDDGDEDEAEATAGGAAESASGAGGGGGEGDGGDAQEGDVLAGGLMPARAAPLKKSKAQLRKEKKLAREREAEEESIRRASTKQDKRAMEMDAVRAALAPLHLRLAEVAADGNCLFSALAMQLPQSDRHDAAALRALAVAALRARADEFAPFVDGDFEAYCEEMANTPAWGGEMEIRALATALQRPIVVYSAFAPPHTMEPEAPNAGPPGEKAAPLTLSFHQHYLALGAHYNAVLPL